MFTAPQRASTASRRGNAVFGAARLSGSLEGHPDNRPPLVLLHGLTFDRRLCALQRVPPADVFTTRLKATPRGTAPEAHFRVRHDRVDPYGRLTIRYLSRLHHIGIGVEHAGTRVHMLVANKYIRVIGDDGSLIRELILDPTRDYQPTGTRPGRRPIGHHVARHVASMS